MHPSPRAARIRYPGRPFFRLTPGLAWCIHLPMDVTAYLRVSSQTQDVATQRASIERAAATRGDVLTAIYQEKKSGKTLARPELDRLRAAVARGEVKRLYVFKLDRLTRSGIRDTFEVVEEFRRHGCEIISVTDGFALDGPAAEVVLAVLAWAAKMERLAINERIAAARQRVEAEGGKWGRPERLTADQKATARSLKDEGKTVRQIAMAVKAPKSTVGRFLTQAA